VFCTLTPRFVVLPGTEGMAGSRTTACIFEERSRSERQEDDEQSDDSTGGDRDPETNQEAFRGWPRSLARSWLPTLFCNAGGYKRLLTLTSKGVTVTETSTDPALTAVIRRHAQEVSGGS